MDFIKGLFAKYAVMGLLILLGVGALYHFATVASYSFRIKALEGQVTVLTEAKATLMHKAATYKIANTQFADSVKKQNQAIDALVAAAEKRKKAGDALLDKAHQEATKNFIDAEYWKNKPVTLSDECLDILATLDEYFAKRKGDPND
jgi:hypothetical protein